MQTHKYVSVGILLAFAAAAAGIYWETRPSAVGEAGKDEVSAPAADFTLPDLQGKPLKLSSLRGETVLLDFWATWCGPCIEDIPTLNALQRRFEDKGFTVAAISLDDASPKEVAAFARERGVDYPIVLAGGQDKLPDGYNVFGLPTAYLIDPSGVIRRKYLGPKSEDEVSRDIEDILRHARS